MKKIIAVCFLAAVVGVSGCKTLGFSDDIKEIKPKAAAPAEAGTPSRVAWQVGIGSSGKVSRMIPAVVNDMVFAAAESGTIAAVNLEGKMVWQTEAGFKIIAGVGADEQLVAVGGPKGTVAAFDASTGRLVWKVAVNGEVAVSPAVGNGVVMVRLLDGRVLGLAKEDGRRKWGYQRVLPSLILRKAAPMTVAEQYVFIGYPGGKLVALEQERGSLVFEENVSIPKGGNELERLTDIASRPVIYGHQICVGAYQGRVGCFNLRGGDAMWFRNISSGAGVDISEDGVFAVGDDGYLYSLDRDLGTERWKAEVLVGGRLSGPVVFNQTVVVGDSFGYLHLFSAADGRMIGRVSVDGTALSATPVMVPDRGIIIQTMGGRLSLLIP